MIALQALVASNLEYGLIYKLYDLGFLTLLTLQFVPFGIFDNKKLRV
jgi:hypothetical protein